MAFFPLFSLRILPAIAVAAVVYFGLRSRLNSTSSLVVFTFLAAIAAAVSAPILLSWVSLWWVLGAIATLLWRRTPATLLVAAAALLMGWTSWQWPDVALVVLAYGFALAVGVAGVWAYRPWH